MLLRIDVFFFFFFFEKMANRRKCLNTKLDIKISGFFQYSPSKTILAHESSLAVKQCFIWLNWKVSAYYNSLVSKRLHVHQKQGRFSGERTCTFLVRFIFLHLASYVGWVWFRYLFFFGAIFSVFCPNFWVSSLLNGHPQFQLLDVESFL